MTVEAANPILRHTLARAFGSVWDRPEVEDIWVNGPGAFLWRAGTDVHEIENRDLDRREILGIATLAAHLRGQRFDPDCPLLDCELPDGERLAAVRAPCIPDTCPVLAIRRGRREGLTLTDLDAQGVLAIGAGADDGYDGDRPEARMLRDAGEVRALLELAIRRRWSIAFVGATGSGKSADMMACVEAIPDDERLCFVGDTNEVPKWLPHRNAVILLAGKHGSIGQGTLIAQALRMSIRWLIPLEIRDGDAAWAFLRALGSGHPGITSWHAPSARRAFSTAAAMMREHAAAAGLGDKDIRDRLRSLVDLVLHVERTPDGRFRVTEVMFGEEIE